MWHIFWTPSRCIVYVSEKEIFFRGKLTSEFVIWNSAWRTPVDRLSLNIFLFEVTVPAGRTKNRSVFFYLELLIVSRDVSLKCAINTTKPEVHQINAQKFSSFFTETECPLVRRPRNAVCSESHVKHTNTQRGKMQSFLFLILKQMICIL
jgi:hypothetical protein